MKYHDFLVAGEPARILIDDGSLRGASVTQARKSFIKDFDALRKELMAGSVHQGAVLFKRRGKDMAFFINRDGYPNMCGHASMAIGKYLKAAVFDTPVGTVSASLVSENTVKLYNVPSFVMHTDVKHKVDYVFCGDIFAMMEDDEHGLTLMGDKVISQVPLALKRFHHAAAAFPPLHHPKFAWLDWVDAGMIYHMSKSGHKHANSLVIWGKDEYDRCPCGTGSSALLALMNYRDARIRQLAVKSVIGTEFVVEIETYTIVGPYHAIRPVVTGEVI